MHKVTEYSIVYRCTRCSFLSNTSGYGLSTSFESVVANAGDIEDCPSCRIGLISASKIIIELEGSKSKEDPFESCTFRITCGACKSPWESRITDRRSELKKKILNPDIPCPLCNNTKENFLRSTGRW